MCFFFALHDSSVASAALSTHPTTCTQTISFRLWWLTTQKKKFYIYSAVTIQKNQEQHRLNTNECLTHFIWKVLLLLSYLSAVFLVLVTIFLVFSLVACSFIATYPFWRSSFNGLALFSSFPSSVSFFLACTNKATQNKIIYFPISLVFAFFDVYNLCNVVFSSLTHTARNTATKNACRNCVVCILFSFFCCCSVRISSSMSYKTRS